MKRVLDPLRHSRSDPLSESQNKPARRSRNNILPVGSSGEDQDVTESKDRDDRPFARDNFAPVDTSRCFSESSRISMRSSVVPSESPEDHDSSMAWEDWDSDHDFWYSLTHLGNSWLMLCLRILHAWSFLLAVTVITGISMNGLMNIFIQFYEMATYGGKALGPEDWGKVLSTLCNAFILIQASVGLLERGFWLIADSLQLDMFQSYRRTLCCEGDGPGSFMKHSRSVKITDVKALRCIHRALSRSCALEYDVELNNTFLPMHSQLLALGQVEETEGRDDLLDLVLPATLVFRVDARIATLHGVSMASKLRGLWDIVLQLAIFTTLDVIPMVWACQDLSFQSIVTFAWRDQFIAAAVIAACGHIGLYYVWSTLMDYWKKYDTWLRLVAQMNEIRDRGSEKRSFVRSFVHTNSATIKGMLEANVEDALGASAVVEQGDSRKMRGREDELNICICIRNYIASRSCQKMTRIYAFVAGCVLLICFINGEEDDVVIPVGVGTIIASMLVGRVACWKRKYNRQTVVDAALQSKEDQGKGLWAIWFRVNCSIEPGVSLAKACVGVVACILFEMYSFYFRIYKGIFIGIGCLGYCCFQLWHCYYHPDTLWRVAVTTSLLTGFFVLCSSVHLFGEEGLLYATTAVLVTQLGLTRQRGSYKHVRTVCEALFTLVTLVIGAVAIMATTKKGFSLEHETMEWCGQDEPECQQFNFPLHPTYMKNGFGGHGEYQFCQLAWPMGTDFATGEFSTVSDTCNDTRLSIVDFALMAQISYHLPEMEQVHDALKHFFPGWHIQDWQSYNSTKGTFTTFLHLARGDTSVIAIRGTFSAIEALQDLTLFLPVAFLQFARIIGPAVFNIRMMVRSIMQLTMKKTRYSQYSDLLNYTRKVAYEHKNMSKPLYITGHSLGGGLGAIVGAVLQVPSITFSAPGLTATSSFLAEAPTLSQLRRTTVNVGPFNDMVPKVDEQTGTLMRLDCSAANPMACHQLKRTVCEIMSSCGNGGGRTHERNYPIRCDYCDASIVEGFPDCNGTYDSQGKLRHQPPPKRRPHPMH